LVSYTKIDEVGLKSVSTANDMKYIRVDNPSLNCLNIKQET